MRRAFPAALLTAIPTAIPLLAQCPTTWAPFAGGLDDSAWALAHHLDGSIVVGGDFLTASGVPVGRLAHWTTGGSWSSLGNGVDGYVRGLAVTPNGDVVAGGTFTHAGGVAANRIARWNGSTWSPLGQGVGPGIVSILLPEASGSLLVGGSFAMAGGVLVNNVARWNGTAWSSLGAGLTSGGVVRALAITPNGDLYAGGLFSTTGSLGIARFDGATWGPVGSGMSGGGLTSVLALLALPDGDVVAGGLFTTAGGVPANYLARWNGSSWSPLGSGTNGPVNTLLRLPDGDLVAGGAFTMAGGTNAPYLARWNGTSWSAMDPSLDAAVEALELLPSGDLVVAGRFTIAGGVPAARIVRRIPGCQALTASYGTGCIGTAGPVALTGTALPWLGGTCRAVATGLPIDALAVAAFGFAQLAMPMPAVHPLGTPGCTLLVTDEILLHVPLLGGSVATALSIPDAAVLIGATFHHQVVVVERDAAGHLAALTASNGLSLTIGDL